MHRKRMLHVNQPMGNHRGPIPEGESQWVEVTAPTQYVVQFNLAAVVESFDNALYTSLGMHTCLRSFEGALLGENCPGTAFSLVMLRRGTRGFTVFDDEFPESEILRGGLELAPTGFRALVILVMFESFFLSGLPLCCCCFRPPVLPIIGIIGIIPPLTCILPALGMQTCQSLYCQPLSCQFSRWYCFQQT